MYANTLLRQINSLDFSKDVLTNLLNYIDNKSSNSTTLYSKVSNDVYGFRNNIYTESVSDLAFLEYGYIIDKLYNVLHKFVDMTSGNYVMKKDNINSVIKLTPIAYEVTGDSDMVISNIIYYVIKYIVSYSEKIKADVDTYYSIEQMLQERKNNNLRNDYIILDPSIMELPNSHCPGEYISVYEKNIFSTETYLTDSLPYGVIVGEFPNDVKNFVKLNINALTKNTAGKLYCNYSLYKVDNANLTTHYMSVV